MLKICALWLLLFALFLPQAYAESKYISQKVETGLFRSLKQEPVAIHVMKVIDPLTFIGEDKEIYMLGGIEIPNLQTGKVDFTTDAVKTVALLMEGKEVKAYVTKRDDTGRLNRMNQKVIHAELNQDNIWVQGELLEAGLARVRTTPTNPEMVAAMLEAEGKARAAKRGIWADEKLAIRTPENIADHMNSFEIVEGTPKAAAMTRNMVFINYGDDYKKDFTIGIPSSMKVALAKRGIDPLKMAHTKLRVRGWVQSYNGPFIEIDHPEQIEILGRLSAFAPSTIRAEPAPNTAGMRTINLPKAPTVEKPAAPTSPKPDEKKNAAQFNP